MIKKYVIKKWNHSGDYWNYLREIPGNIESFSTEENFFVYSTIKDARKFDTYEEAEDELNNWLMTPSYFKIEKVYIPTILN